MYVTRSLAAAALLAIAAGCGSSTSQPGGSASAGVGGSVGVGGSGSGGAETVAKLPAGWNEIKPGGESICSRGGEFAFWARPGKVNRLIVDFIGGGACWNQLTCSIAGQLFSPDVQNVRDAVAKNEPHGLYDHDRADNPFADWHHVIIPYCTGDIHWGNAVKDYGDNTIINHKGAVNTKAVLDWIYQNYSGPEAVLVTGCSAGSYGSAMWAAHVAKHYEKAHVMQFGDSGAGIITQDFFKASFPNWNAKPIFPTWISALDPSKVDVEKLTLVDLYAFLVAFYPQHQFSQYNTAFDKTQTFYFTAMGGKKEDWSPMMLQSIADIDKRAPAFGSFVPSGEQHCILLTDNFYTVNAGGVRLIDWLKDMAAKKPLVDAKCAKCDTPTP